MGASAGVERPGALAGARVLDMTAMWSGPSATRLLARFGADVVKVESPTRLDGARRRPSVFRALNEGKRSILLDLRTSDGHELFCALSERADVIVENFSPRILRSFRLTYDVLSQRNTGLVMLSMPAYGTSGPQSNWIGFGWELEASGGLSDMMRDAAGRPTSTGLPLADPAAGAFGALAVLGAMLRREKTGRGCHIDLAQREVVLSLIGDKLLSAGGGTHTPRLKRCFLCVDGWLIVSVRTPRQWTDLAADLDIQQPALRAGTEPAEAAIVESAEILAATLGTRLRHEAIAWLNSRGACANAIADAHCVVARLRTEPTPTEGDALPPDGDRDAILADWLA